MKSEPSVWQRHTLFENHKLSSFHQFLECIFQCFLYVIPRSIKSEYPRYVTEEFVSLDTQAISHQILHGYRDLLWRDLVNGAPGMTIAWIRLSNRYLELLTRWPQKLSLNPQEFFSTERPPSRPYGIHHSFTNAIEIPCFCQPRRCQIFVDWPFTFDNLV